VQPIQQKGAKLLHPRNKRINVWPEKSNVGEDRRHIPRIEQQTATHD
jgi:hypothetical protein